MANPNDQDNNRQQQGGKTNPNQPAQQDKERQQQGGKQDQERKDPNQK